MITKCAPIPIVAAITLWQLMHLGQTPVAVSISQKDENL